MNNHKEQLISSCMEEPSLIFNLIKQGYYEEVYDLVSSNKVNINICDSVGNDVVTRLLKVKQYDIVLELMKKRNWDVNHQNIDGNTFGHILAQDNSISALRVVEQLTKKKNYIPNIKNNKGETVLDRAINNNYIYTAIKILEDKRFDNIDLISFKRLWDVCIKNKYYGKYAKLNNLEVIVDSLDKKELIPSLRELIEKIINNIEFIKNAIIDGNSKVLDNVIYSYVEA